MRLAPAPRRTARTWSVLALGLLALGDVALVFLVALTEFALSAPTVAVINAVCALIILWLRFLPQTIALTNVEKVDLLRAAANAPMLPVERDVLVRIGNEKIN